MQFTALSEAESREIAMRSATTAMKNERARADFWKADRHLLLLDVTGASRHDEADLLAWRQDAYERMVRLDIAGEEEAEAMGRVRPG